MFLLHPSLISNKFHQKGFTTWYPVETVGKDAEEEEKEEEEEEDQEEEEEEEDEEEDEEEEEKNVELLHSPVTLLPDLMEFERCEQLGEAGLGMPGAPVGKGTEAPAGACCSLSVLSEQGLSHGSSRISIWEELGDGVSRGSREIVLKLHWHSTYTVFT